MLTHQRNKSSRTKRGCIACYNIGAASRAFGYIDIQMPGMIDLKTRTVQMVIKEIGLCFTHTRDLCDKKVGVWNKAAFNSPIRDEKYVIRCPHHRSDCPMDHTCPVEDRKRFTQILTGPAGNIPLWW